VRHLCCPLADGGAAQPQQQQQQQHRKLSKVEELMQRDLAAKQRQAASAAAAAAAAAAKAPGPSGGGSSGAGGSGRLDHWLHEGIVVKVLSAALKQAGYYKQKVCAGRVRRVCRGADQACVRSSWCGLWRARLPACVWHVRHGSVVACTAPPPLRASLTQGVVSKVVDKYVGELVMNDSGDVLRVDQTELETVLPAPGGAVLVVNGHHRGLRALLVDINTERFQAEVELREGALAGTKAWLDYEDVCKLSAV
jgi:hypothetical protein